MASTPFLKQVAVHYLESKDFPKLCFIFPNRRSIAFFRKYVSETVAEKGLGPFILPKMTTIGDFLQKISGTVPQSRIPLLLDLYESYRAVNPKAEPLDEFIFWGEIILADFDDIDKYLIDPDQIFTNVSDYRNLQDNFDYLTETQKKAMERFVWNFGEGRRKTESALAGRANIKESFATIWSLLAPLYKDFTSRLREKGAAYPGMAYKAVCDRLATTAVTDILSPAFPRSEKFVFVGLNVLCNAEHKMLSAMKKAGIADFCWDYVGRMITDKGNCSSRFMDRNIADFGQSIELEKESEETRNFSIIKVPSSTGQVKHIPDIINGLDKNDTAIVLPDESLLPSVLNTLPEDVTDINVTMGYPVSASEFHSLMDEIMALQIHTRRSPDGKVSFYHKQVEAIFSSGIIRRVMEAGEDEGKSIKARINEIRQAAKYYIPVEDLKGNDLFEAIFVPVVEDLKESSAENVLKIENYLLGVASFLAPRMKKSHGMVLELDFAKRYYNSISALTGYRLDINIKTFSRLLSQMTGGETVPFNGEPLRGLQIMGPLETRALDFKNLIILSANEGIFPRHAVSSSFIPPELRSGFDLPTTELQDSVWAYYFYRMITRAENIWMIWDSRTEGVQTGEESRYIKQLRYIYDVRFNEYISNSPLRKPEDSNDHIDKTEDDIEKIKETVFSASLLNNCICCPLQFYYERIAELKKADEVMESLDSGSTGTVFHAVARSLYHSPEAVLSPIPTEIYMKSHPKGLEYITADYLREWKKREDDIRRKVEVEICYIMKTPEVRGRDILMKDIITRYVKKLIESDLAILRENSRTRFHILGLEERCTGEIEGLSFKGFVDRIDSFDDGTIRVVDYKTGADDPAALDTINRKKEDKQKQADILFNGGHNDHYKKKLSLQFQIYDIFVSRKFKVPVSKIVNTVYSAAEMFKATPKLNPADEEYLGFVTENMAKWSEELLNKEIPFYAKGRTYPERNKTCEYCNFSKICGR